LTHCRSEFGNSAKRGVVLEAKNEKAPPAVKLVAEDATPAELGKV
jgi:hypothetical protein